MTKRIGYLMAFVGLSLFSPLSALAQDYRIDYAGIITGGSDIDNVFGFSQLPSLTGLSFNASVGYSTSVVGTRMTTQNSDEVTGGLGFGTDAVISSILFTVGGRGFSFSPDFYSDVYTSPTLLTTYGYDLAGNSLLTYFIPDQSDGPSMFGINYVGTGSGDTGGEITQDSRLITGQDAIDFDTVSATVSAVPEPNTWVMLLLGFGALGFKLRRRVRTPVVSVLEV